MILMLFLYELLYTSSHALESDYPLSGLNDENSPIPQLNVKKSLIFARESDYGPVTAILKLQPGQRNLLSHLQDFASDSR